MKTNPSNERVKRDYFRYLKEALGRDEATIDRVAKSIARFEESTSRKDFKRFHREQAVAFKAKLNAAKNSRTGKPLSKATILAAVSDLRAFFLWLAREHGFKSHVAYSDADYFSMSEKDIAVARAPRDKRVPSLEQARRALCKMPTSSLVERRDRALFAFALITGARIGALASFRLKHVDLAAGMVNQDARSVRTKASKSFVTCFMPVDPQASEIVEQWLDELKREHCWGPDDPLFPATEIALGRNGTFEAVGLTRRCWSGSQSIRDIFRRAFLAADLPYFNPHTFRDMLVHYAMSLGLGPEEMKAWSQNLGHADVLTTFTSYGTVPLHRQHELIRNSNAAATDESPTHAEIAALRSLLAKAEGNSLRPQSGSC